MRRRAGPARRLRRARARGPGPAWASPPLRGGVLLGLGPRLGLRGGVAAVDAGVLRGLGLSQLLAEAETEHDDGPEQEQEDDERRPAGLHVLRLRRLVVQSDEKE